jgi:dihydropteroate synthase
VPASPAGAGPQVRPAIWGILNVTPDSFSDGGDFISPMQAFRHGRRLIAEGADVLDVGGESTRPGAQPVGRQEEIDRVCPVIEALRAEEDAVPISVDTRHAAVAAAALAAGAGIVNDVSAGGDPDMFAVVAASDARLVLMHMRGTPETMQDNPSYRDVVADVGAHLVARVAAAEAAGIPRSRLIADPGIGFGKTLAHNLALHRSLEALTATLPGIPWLLGSSRKSFLGTLTNQPDPRARLIGSLACAIRAAEADWSAVRVHDVAETREMLEVWAALRSPASAGTPRRSRT